jgi:mannosyltransferase
MGIRIRDTLRDEWLYIGACAAIVVAAFLLRIYQIGQGELWLDEAFSFYMVTISKWPGDLLKYDNPPVYYFLLLPWLQLAGQSETAIRMLSAIFSVLFVAAVFWVGNMIFGKRVALWSGIVSALAPVQIYYAQEARTYALVILVLTLAYGTLWRALETQKWQWWAGFSLCTLLAVYSHYFAILGLIPTALLVWLWPEQTQYKQRWIPYLVTVCVSGFLFLPWFVWSFWLTPHPLSSNDWIRPLWRETIPLLAIPKSLEVFTLGSQSGFTSVINVKRFGDIIFPSWLRLIGLAAAALLAISVALPYGDKELALPWLGRRKTWLWTLLLFPLIALWLISFFYRPFYAVGRYDIVAFPAFALLLGLALTKIQSIEKIGLVLVSFIAIALFVPIGAKLLAYYSVPSEPFARATALALHQFVRNQDALVLSRPRAKTTIYYLTRLGYEWKDGHCNDGSAGHAFSCWMFPPDTTNTSAPSSAERRPGRSEAFRNLVQEYVRALRQTDGVLWMVIDGEILSNGRLKLRPPESYLVTVLDKWGLHPVPIDSDLGIVQFR